MPRPERIFQLFQLLAGRRPVTIEEIAQRFDVSERTAYRDLQMLEQRHRVPLVSQEGGFRVVEGSTMRTLLLTPEERVILELALDHPAIRQRPALAVRLRSLEAKLHAAQHSPAPVASALALAPRDRTGASAEPALAALETAISAHRVCDVVYVSLSDGRPRTRRLHPLRLFLRADTWYLAAFAPEYGEVRTFRLDRFDDVRALEDRFAPPAFDLDAYLADTWDLFRGDGEFEVHLRFDPSLAPLLVRAKHHPKETVERREDGIHYRIRVTHLDELARWIVGFGGNVVVLGPEALRARVVELAWGVVEANRAERRRRAPVERAGDRQEGRRARN